MELYMISETPASLTTFRACRAGWLTCLFLSLALVAACGQAHAQTTGPKIEITTVPPTSAAGSADVTHPIAGKITGASSGDYAVALYAHAGDTWWVQPTVDK